MTCAWRATFIVWAETSINRVWRSCFPASAPSRPPPSGTGRRRRPLDQPAQLLHVLIQHLDLLFARHRRPVRRPPDPIIGSFLLVSSRAMPLVLRPKGWNWHLTGPHRKRRVVVGGGIGWLASGREPSVLETVQFAWGYAQIELDMETTNRHLGLGRREKAALSVHL